MWWESASIQEMLRGYEIGRMVRERGAWVVFGGVHASLFPEEALELGSAHSVVKGDGDVAWAEALTACKSGAPVSIYEGGRIEADRFLPARWNLLPAQSYMWASVQTLRGTQSIAHSARCGAPMASIHGNARLTASSGKSSSFAARASASPLWRLLPRHVNRLAPGRMPEKPAKAQGTAFHS